MSKILVIVESIALIYLSLLPAGATPSTGIAAPRLGDLEHFLAYFLYGALLSLAFLQKSKKRFFSLLVLGSAFGLFTEELQLFIPTRTFDLLDWLTDTAGVAIGASVVWKAKPPNQRTLASFTQST